MNKEAMKAIKNIREIQGNIANDVWPDGWKGACYKCGKPFFYTRDECAYYLAHGWPKCSCTTQLPDAE